MMNRFLISLLILVICQAQRICDQCSTFSGEKRMCASNGELFQDLFCAQCASNGRNYKLYDCTRPIHDECVAECTKEYKEVQCRNSCVPTIPFKYYCGNHGSLYTNLCHLKCLDFTIEKLFDCSVYRLSLRNCSSKCSQILYCKNLYQDKPSNPVCGKDGLLYQSIDELRCNGEYLVMYNQDLTVDYNGTKDCWNYAMLTYGRVVGETIRPIYYPQGTPSQ